MLAAIMCIFALTACKGNENDAAPTPDVTEEPTTAPTAEPTKEAAVPTAEPTAEPTKEAAVPTAEPTAALTGEAAKVPAEETGSDAANAASAAEDKIEAGEIYDGEGDFPDPGPASGDTVLPTPTPVTDDIPGGDTPYIPGVDIPDNLVPDYVYPDETSAQICRAYAAYIADYVFTHPEYKDSLRLGGGFLDDDYIPELLVMDSEDAKLRIVTYDMEKDSVSVVDEIDSNTIFAWITGSGFVMGGNTEDTGWQVASFYTYDKSGLIPGHTLRGMDDSDEFYVDDKPVTEEEAMVLLEEYVSFFEDYADMDDFEYSYADEYNYFGDEKDDIAEIIYDSIRWKAYKYYVGTEPDDPLEYDDDYDTLFGDTTGLSIETKEYYDLLSGNWEINRLLYFSEGDPIEVDVRKCKAAFSADADTETVSLDFEHDGTNVAISNEYVYFFEYDEAFGEASMKNKSGKYWYGDISYGDYGIVVRMADENTLVVYLFSLLSDEGYEIIFIR